MDGANLSPMWLKKVAMPWSAPPSYIRSSESPFGIRSVAGPWHTPSLYVLSSVAPDSAKYTAGPCTRPSLHASFNAPVSCIYMYICICRGFHGIPKDF